jgi:predicted AAA+ superfamily ATPase
MIERYITPFVRESFGSFPAVVINGARQVGKSTLAQLLKKEHVISDYITLDDLTTLNAARSDPIGFIERFKAPVAIDEVQRAPDLMLAIKKSIDEDRRPGRFLLTGSASVLSRVSESLAGRMDVISLEGLSAGEKRGLRHPSTVLKDLFSGASMADLSRKWSQERKQRTHVPLSQSIKKEIFFGGFPEVSLKENLRFRERWFSSYQAAYIERDVRDIARPLDVVSFSKCFKLLGPRTGNLANYKNLAVDVQLDQRTIARYIEILEVTFQMTLLRPWFVNTTKRLIKTPKVYVNDSGLACSLVGIGDSFLEGTTEVPGALYETWFFSELRKLLSLETGIECHFYRTHLGKEVDFILSKGNSLWGLEFKAAKSVSIKDFTGLKDFCEAAGPHGRGMVVYFGDQIIPFSSQLIAVPVDCFL